MFLEKSVLFALLITCVCSQTCENEAVEQFVKKKENATLEVITNLQNIVLQSSNSSFNGTHNQTTLYSTLTASFSLTESEETLEQFSKAIDVITDAYFKSCYGPEEEKPTVQDAPDLLQTFLTLLANRTDFTTIREIYGKLTCLQVFQPDEIIVKREGEDDEVDLLECAEAKSVIKLYECLDPKDLSCVFDIDIEQDCDDLEMIQGDISKYAKNCLAFVVDTTGSMSEEIVAARQVITSFIQSEENILTLCYILVPFNDFGNMSIEDNLEYAKVYYAHSLQEDDPFKVYDGQGNEQVVHGVADLLTDVNGLYAHGGGDCPEYGMIAILKANELLNGIQSKQAKDGQHHIIVLTDASAKDDYLYQDVIGNITDESNVDVTVHFFFSGFGCPGFGKYSNIANATDGITVSQINAASFPSFVEYIESFSDPDVETLSKRSVLTQCNSFIISVFVTSFSTLIKTSQPIVNITKPDGTLETLTTIGNSFVIYESNETSNPQPGEWSACVSSGTIEQSISLTVELDLSVEHVKLDAMGQLLPSTELPFACDMSIFTASTSKLSQISLNNTLYLDFVDNDRNILQYTEITECKGILSGSVILPSTPLKYQLRGYDIQGNPFSHLVSDLLITFEYPDFQIALIGSPIVVVNPGKQSLVRMSVQNTKKGPKNLVISATVTTTAGIGVEFVEDDVSLIPQTEIELSFYLIASDSVIEGQMLDLSFVVTDECTNVPTSMPFQAIVKTAIALVPSAPRELAGEISNDTSVYLSWNFPEEPNGVLLSFHLFYGKTGSTKTEMGVIVPVTGNSYQNFAVHDLESEEEYYFKVAASNYAGMGENSTELVIVIPALVMMIPADTSEINALLIALPTVLGILFIVTIVTVIAILLTIWFRRTDTRASAKMKKNSNL